MSGFIFALKSQAEKNTIINEAIQKHDPNLIMELATQVFLRKQYAESIDLFNTAANLFSREDRVMKRKCSKYIEIAKQALQLPEGKKN